MPKFIGGWVLAIILLVTSLVHAEVVDRIVAVINDEIILLSEMNAAFEPYRSKIEASYIGEEREATLAEARQAFLNRLIDVRLIEKEAKQIGISVKEEDLMAVIKDVIGHKNISLEDFTKELVKGGISLEVYKNDIREQMVKMRVVQREIRPKLIVTDKEIGEYYKEHRDDYEGQEAVRINQIFFDFSKLPAGEAKSKVRKVAEQIDKRLKEGESFEMLAANLSSETAQVSGDLGFIAKGTVLPALEKVAFSLKKGEVSGIIESPSGFHIIKVLDKKGGGLKPVEEVREEIRAKIEDRMMGEKFVEWLAGLRKKSHIENKL